MAKISGSDLGSLVIAEAGCKTGFIIRKTMAVGVTVPLGARPSVGAGLWLHGGIGHLARLYGLACDAIVGAVIVSVESGQVFCVGCVPSQHCPSGAVRPENELDLLWAIKGAGTNFGILVSVTFKSYKAPTYLTRDWVVPLSGKLEARLKLSDFDRLVARKLPPEQFCRRVSVLGRRTIATWRDHVRNFHDWAYQCSTYTHAHARKCSFGAGTRCQDGGRRWCLRDRVVHVWNARRAWRRQDLLIQAMFIPETHRRYKSSLIA